MSTRSKVHGPLLLAWLMAAAEDHTVDALGTAPSQIGVPMNHRCTSRDPRMVSALFTVMVLVAVLATLFGMVGLAGIVAH
jgi:hypothetical protein